MRWEVSPADALQLLQDRGRRAEFLAAGWAVGRVSVVGHVALLGADVEVEIEVQD